MDLFRTKFILLLISFTLLFGAGMGAFLYYLFPNMYPQYYVSIPAFFFLMGLALIYIIDAGTKKLEQKKLVNLYISTRVAKILLSLVFIGIYSLVVKTGMKNFALVFMLFYLFSIMFEIYFFISIERRIKATNNK